MKTRITTLGLLASTCFVMLIQASERATVKDGRWLIVNDDGAGTIITNDLEFTPSIKLFTNGTFAVGEGKPRTLSEGQSIDRSGMLTTPDGSVGPVEDHFAMKSGRLYVVQSGTISPVNAPLALPGGISASPDGFVTTSKGKRSRLLDGQWFKLDGSTIPARDNITLRDGKVVVQKDGSLMTVQPGRSLMMNDGTKVSGDGTVTKPDGSRIRLQEGKPLQIEGVVRNLR
jgi:hypothetical protein